MECLFKEVAVGGSKGSEDTTQALSVQGAHYWMKLHQKTRKTIFNYFSTLNSHDLMVLRGRSVIPGGF